MYDNFIGTRCPACAAMLGEPCGSYPCSHEERVEMARLRPGSENDNLLEYEESLKHGQAQGSLDGLAATGLDPFLNPLVPVGMDTVGFTIGYLQGLILFLCDRRNALERQRPKPGQPAISKGES